MVHRNLIKIDCGKKSDKTTHVSVFTAHPTAGLICNDILTGQASLAFHTTRIRDLITRKEGQTKTQFSSIKSCNPALIMADGREIVLGMKLRVTRSDKDVSHFSI